MTDRTLKSKFDIRELELNALLEVTQAINDNVPESSLYKIYNFILRSNLNIRKLALFVLDETWKCKVNFGTVTDFFSVVLPEAVLSVNEIRHIDNQLPELFQEFSLIVPVAHKKVNIAMVFIGGLNKEDHAFEDEDGVKFIQALSNIILVAMENKKLARKELDQQAFRKELEIASTVQQFLFPEKLPNTAVLKMEASYLPHDRVGGDYYDYIPINKNQFLMCVADVSGKGIPAALMMSNFQASLRTLLRQTPNLKDIVEALNFQVMENAKGEKFITFFGAIYDISLRTLVYVNSGHNPPILCVQDKGVQVLEEGSTVLGAMHPLPFLNEGFISNLDDFLLFCYTDGLTETTNEQNKEYGSKALYDYFQKKETLMKSLQTIHQDIIVSLDHFKGTNGYHDDITMLSCRVSR